uniref:Uncharacterized protein n=1 Tax=viral metagenome TaxID=1070528 RepID=A0A6C0C1J4_9ZZZZ
MQQFPNSATRSACGEGDTLCSEALKNDYTNVLRSDTCAISTENNFNVGVEDYILWVPKYRRKVCEGNAYLNCSADTDRFGPKQITQESFLQGRGQVADNPNCPAGGVKYLPETLFNQEDKPKQVNMSLFSQPTLVPRSCGTLTEVDLQRRMLPLPGAWQGSFSPLVAVNFEKESAASERRQMKPTTTTSLGNKNKYPEWTDLKAQSEPYSQ